jgi:hypothetical protein
MSFFSNLFGGSKASYERDEYGTLNPEQKLINKTLGNYLNSAIGKELPMYSNRWQDYTSELTPGEQEAINRNSRLTALGETGLQPLLKGEFPEEYYQSSIYNPLKKQFVEDVLPAIQENYAGTGGYWGSARADAVAKGYRDLYDTLANKRAELAWNVQKNVPTAINAANALTAQELQTQQVPRLIKQYGLDQLYNEWVRTRPENQTALLNSALQFMNISTVTERAVPAKSSNWGAIANIAGIALAPFTGGASIPIGTVVGGGIDAATSPTGQGGAWSAGTGALAGALGGLGYGANSTYNIFKPATRATGGVSNILNNEYALNQLRDQGNVSRLKYL